MNRLIYRILEKLHIINRNIDKKIYININIDINKIKSKIYQIKLYLSKENVLNVIL